jgi:hypothetical protein
MGWVHSIGDYMEGREWRIIEFRVEINGFGGDE